ncbi:MAG: hypothetical protein HYU64_15930 [Armatimonadetes bacterium]|nr:hypothetical protein [Armatimonadota bacterium]
MKSDLELLDRLGLAPFTKQELSGIFESYREELQRGLEGSPSSLAMFRSLLRPVSLSTVSRGREALVLEVGGTNLYGAKVRVEENGPVILEAHQVQLEKTKFRDAREFYEVIADKLAPVVSHTSPEALGIVYSFPGKAAETPRGVDVLSDEKTLTKGFAIPRIGEEGVGQGLMRVLHERHGLSLALPTAVLNDTVAVLFAAGARLGGVVGTGFNLAVTTPEGIINTESGGFDKAPLNELERLVDRGSDNPGRQLAEKQISGLYLGKQFEIVLQRLAREGLMSQPVKDSTGAKAISEVLRGRLWQEKGPRKAAVRLRDRSAQLVGAMIAAAIETYPEQFTDSLSEIPVEGSLFWGMPGYEEKVKEVMAHRLDRKIRFLNIEHAGRIGAAVAALGFAKVR